MTERSEKFTVLLIDDDPYMEESVERALGTLTKDRHDLYFVNYYQDGCALLKESQFDLVLLDNFLSSTDITAKQTVPMIREAAKDCRLSIVTNDTSPDYLQDPKKLGVDSVVDKINLISFLKEQVEGWEKRSAA